MSTKKEKTERKGLTTVDALNQLHEDINEVLKKYEISYETESWFKKVKYALLKPYDTPMGLFPFIATIISTISLYSTGYIFSATILLIILLFNTYIVIRENNLRNTEIYRKIRRVLDDINVAKKLCKDWTFNNYPHLCSPLSPCVTLQWTYRDNHIVNLPWALLVRGDYIVLRPGQVAPGTCSEINGKRNFKCGETYGLTQPMDPPMRPTARLPLPDLVCKMEMTPYLDNLKTSLENFLNRPATISNQQRYLMITQCIQQWGLSIIFLLTIIAGGIHYSELLFFGNNKINWIELFIEIPIITIIPTLPLIFPVLWIFTNLWGIAKLQTLLSIPQPNITSEKSKSFQEDLDTPTFDWEHIELSSKQVFLNWIGLIKGNSDLLGRSANIVQVLGSVTALCCVDKKGILSWPNPTAEKVFFLHDSTDKVSKMSSQSSLESDDTTQQRAGTTAEVLDLTHDQHSPFKLEFDDHEWKNHINSLKPLGLAILVNTCCPLTQAYYAQFCGHVTAVAMLDKDLVPVTNRYAIVESSLNSFMHGRCLCELAKQIGFTPQARDIFNLEGQIASYKHLQPEVVRRDIRFARQLQLASKVKVPFPHSLSVVMRESHDGSLQLLTQGTADLVLDCCDDYWDGKDLRPLRQQERKRAQDFYQRSALTAYCTAFAYRPLRHGIRGSLSGINTNDIAYLELPPEAKYQLHHVDNKNCNFDGHHSTLNHSISTDSLLFSDIKEDDIADVEGCYEMQCHQVFIGMVTMQYQAQTDIVQLIERLDNACIRFVHFSKENELRSRVFSEKMGLESGWNCHISLLSEDHSILPSPKSSHTFECTTQLQGSDFDNPVANIIGDHEMSHLLSPFCLETSKVLSSSAPGAISDQECYNSLQLANGDNLNTASLDDSYEMLTRHRSSRDSAMDCHTNDEKYRSISCLTDSTEQSAPVHFDMSNRAKLPRGIENIQPHLENVDNVPLLVSLFTDCSAEATREMLNIMQQYGEIVVCIGSSSSNSNAEIFLQADCSIAVEPLYPQVCQDYPSYNESNIYNNHLNLTREENLINKNNQKWFKPILPLRNSTISPVYLSRMLNSISCSIAVCRDDPLSIVSLIELSRRFTTGLWNCIQFWSCCTCTLVLLNFLASLLFLPIMLTPMSLLYLMCIAIPLLSVSLSRTQSDPKHIMNRATGKKQTKFNSRIFIFVLWSYGCKFIPPILIMILSYCTFMSHPITILNTAKDDYEINLKIARIFILYSIVVHFVIISTSFVHRESLIWQKNPFTNHCWLITCCLILIFHTLICLYQVINDDDIIEKIDKTWPVILFLLLSIIITFSITELCKWEEIKVNLRYQRRARLDFGTKLGMNSPF